MDWIVLKSEIIAESKTHLSMHTTGTAMSTARMMIPAKTPTETQTHKPKPGRNTNHTK